MHRAEPLSIDPAIDHVPATMLGRLLVFYIPDAAEWQVSCKHLLDAGFMKVAPYNEYWQQLARGLEISMVIG